MYRESLLLE